MTRRELGRTLSARVTDSESNALAQLARRHDRSISREISRAIRHYLAHPEAAEQPLPLQDRTSDDRP
jgi:predicted transcriptional regulator